MNSHRGLRIWGVFSAMAAMVGMTGCNVYVTPHHAYVYSQPAVVYSAPPPTYVAYPPPQPLPAAQAAPPAPADAELQQLVAPIALYPDPLLAQVLTASTYPQQVQEAEQWLQGNPTPSQPDIDAQPWDPTIKALVHYPTVLQYMAMNMSWTQSLGSAFATNQPGVNAAVQDLRAQASSVGSLRSTPQQAVLTQGSYIYIQPADPNLIYVPTYDPAVVYVQPAPIAFGVGWAVGPWLSLGFDWGTGYVFVGDWHGGWYWGPHGWGWNYHWHSGYHYWGRSGRWGPPPHVAHYAVHGDFRGRGFRPVPVHRGGYRGDRR